MRRTRLAGRLTALMASAVLMLTTACGLQSAHVRLASRPAAAHIPVLLTFDDGPDPVWTPQILSALKREHVHAVFCVTGEHAAMWPALIRRIVAEGNTLCVHSWDHPHMLTISAAAQHREIARTQALLVSLAGRGPLRYWRAPYGQSSAALDGYARSLGLAPLGWNAEGSDWTPGITAATVDHLEQVDLARLPLKQWAQPPGATPPGVAVVLLHDALGENHSRASVRRSASLAAVVFIAEHYRIAQPV